MATTRYRRLEELLAAAPEGTAYFLLYQEPGGRFGALSSVETPAEQAAALEAVAALIRRSGVQA